MTKKIYILLIAFGFFMIPNAIFACNSHTQKKTPNKEMSAKNDMEAGCNHNSSKSARHNCCDKSSSNGKTSKGCTGKCGHSNCTVSTVPFALVIPFINDFSVENDFYFSEKINYNYLKTNISSGFFSVWLIPKIG